MNWKWISELPCFGAIEGYSKSELAHVFTLREILLLLLQIINTIQKSLYKRLREAHTSVSLCSATGMFNSDVSSFYDPSIFFLISLQHVNQLFLSFLYKICSSVQFIPWRPWTGQCYFMLHCLTCTFLLSTCKMQILAILLGFFYFNLYFFLS